MSETSNPRYHSLETRAGAEILNKLNANLKYKFVRCILLSICLLLNSFAFAQNKIIGKWKPVFFSLNKLITGDVKADTTFLSDTLDVVFKNDKDPQASKEMMVFMADMILKKMKDTEQEFIGSGEYIETNKSQNRTTKGTYTYDELTDLLIVKNGNKINKFTISFKNKNLLLTSEMESRNGKKGELFVEYELVQ